MVLWRLEVSSFCFPHFLFSLRRLVSDLTVITLKVKREKAKQPTRTRGWLSEPPGCMGAIRLSWAPALMHPLAARRTPFLWTAPMCHQQACQK